MHPNQAEDNTGYWGDQAAPTDPTVDPFGSAPEQFEQMVERLQSGSLAHQEHSEVEEWLNEEGRELYGFGLLIDR